MAAAQPVKEHYPWCVRNHTHGQCSEKRGKWDRSTNTWDSDLSAQDRRVMAEALKRWRTDGEPIQDVADWVRTHDTFQAVENTALCSWWMTHLRMAKKGKSWPVLDTAPPA